MDCKEGIQSITEQMIDVLNRIDPVVYRQSLDLYDGASLGKHFRHIYDFYSCLIRGVGDGKVDYSSRKRESAIERQPKIAAQAFAKAATQLAEVSTDLHLKVLADFSADNNYNRQAYDSCFGREITFLHDHAVHHLAIVRMGLKQLNPEFSLSKQLGVAPSTIKYEATSSKK